MELAVSKGHGAISSHLLSGSFPSIDWSMLIAINL